VVIHGRAISNKGNQIKAGKTITTITITREAVVGVRINPVAGVAAKVEKVPKVEAKRAKAEKAEKVAAEEPGMDSLKRKNLTEN